MAVNLVTAADDPDVIFWHRKHAEWKLRGWDGLAWAAEQNLKTRLKALKEKR